MCEMYTYTYLLIENDNPESSIFSEIQSNCELNFENYPSRGNWYSPLFCVLSTRGEDQMVQRTTT